RTEEQRLLAQKNEVEKDKLTLARVIGLASDQQFTVAGDLNTVALRATLDELLRQAYEHRADYRAAQANVRAAELAVQAALAERLPTVVVQADYGDIGTTFANSHGTYTFVAGVNIPIYSGGRSRANIDEADVVLRTRKNAVEELRSRLDFELRNALLDLHSTEEQVAVAKENNDLAAQTLEQARDRFSAGIAENIEVIQAQQLVAGANDNYINSVNAHNSARIALATAAGLAEDGVLEYLGLKQ
ncbi:MAG TPA: TolC family protein, partial [Bryobacteraceae bacterium]|nr:TolC family protein [Bryobacteraceae bacterium]